MNVNQQNNGSRISFKVILPWVLAFVALEAGIVLAGFSLHGIANGHSAPRMMAVTWLAAGLLLIFISPLVIIIFKRFRPVITWHQVVAALSNFGLAAWFVLGWAAPKWISKSAVEVLSGIVVLEVIIIFASICLVTLPRNISKKDIDVRWWRTEGAGIVFMVVLYSIFAAGISFGFKSWWLFVSFWMLMGNKFIDVCLAPAADEEERVGRHMERWEKSLFTFLILMPGSLFIPVPKLGAVSIADKSISGWWIECPEQTLVMGAMYFTILAFYEMYGVFNVKKVWNI